MELFIHMVVEAIFIFLLFALAAATLFGLAITIRPTLLERVRLATDRRFDFSGSSDWLDRPRNVDRLFYRYHYAYGFVVITLAVLLLYFLAFGYERPVVELLLPREYRMLADILADTARLVMWALSIFSLIIGTIMLVRPSALKGFEQVLNRWLSTKDAARRLDREFRVADNVVQRYPRAAGTVIALLALAGVIGLVYYWGAWVALIR